MDRIKYLITIVAVLFSWNCSFAETEVVSGDTIPDKVFLPEKDFFYADTKRYTITGELPLLESQIKPLNLAILGGGAVGIFAIQHYLQMETIWKEQGEFKFMEDGQYALYADKAGHFFGAYFVSYLVRESLITTGLSWDMSYILGAAIGLAYSTYVEVLDGYGKNWGFSPTDFYADVAGAAFFLGQRYVPYLQNFTPKFMYIPANWHGEQRRNPHDAFIDDYSSHTLWLSANIHNMLPDDLKDYWPSWLELSFGYAVRNLCAPVYGCETSTASPHYDKNGNVEVYGDVKYILALDYNFVKLLPDGCALWNWFKQSLNIIKFPSPAIEFGSKTKFFLLYPFSINF